MNRCKRLPVLLCMICVLRPTVSFAAATSQPSAPASSLTSLSIEDLMNVQVTTVEKAPQKLADAPAAVTVIQQYDMEHSGLDSVPELLRLVPGMDVEQVNNNRWAITSRGLNGLFADDLLVLMDGRSVYTPVFGGVRWNAVDYPMDDLDRVEVIRGPGSTLWGSNAVNGVINIETKPANETQGIDVESRLSTDQSSESVRYGGQLDDDTYYRVYEKTRYTDDGETSTDDPAHDYWSAYQSGFRIDRNASPEDTLTFQGDGYYQQLADVGLVVTPALNTDFENGANVLGRWTHTASDRDSSSLQVYYDRQCAEDSPTAYEQNQFDLDFQDRFALGDPMEITWGLGARDTQILFQPQPTYNVSPRNWSDYQYSGFIQSQLTVIPNQVQWYAGTKLEYARIADFQVQPSTRLLWTPDDQNSVWAAASRSVRVPSIYQESTLSLGGLAVNHDDLSAEQTISYEVGYKVQPTKTFTADVTGFYNSYRDLITYNTEFLPAPLFLPYGVIYDNDLKGDTYGTELAADWQALPNWRLQASYTLLRAYFQPQDSSGGLVSRTIIRSFDGSAPQNQFQVHSYLDVMKNLQFNTSLYYVDALPTLYLPPTNSQKVPAHMRVDVGLTWQVNEHASIAAGVQNLQQNRHAEFGNFNSDIQDSQVQRAFYLQGTISY